MEIATVEISEPTTATQTYDPDTNTWTSTPVIVWDGPARIQPFMTGTVGQDNNDYNPTTSQNLRIQISAGRNTVTGSNGAIPDIRPNHRVRVTGYANDNGSNSNLTNFLFVVVSVINSSNAWERTIVCKVDSELDPNVTEA